MSTAKISLYKSDIVIDPFAFETIPERPLKMICVYRSVIQSDDPDWKVQLATDMIASLGISFEFLNECFVLHNSDLLYKEKSESSWRIVKAGIFCTILNMEFALIEPKTTKYVGCDDSSLSMILESNEEGFWDAMEIEKENAAFPLPQISFPTKPSSLRCSNDESSVAAIFPPSKSRHSMMSDITSGTVCFGSEQMLNDTIKSLDVSCADSFDWDVPTKAADVFPDEIFKDLVGSSYI